MSDRSEAAEYRIVADGETARERLDRLLSRSLDGLSRMRIKALIVDGRARIAGRTVTEPSYRVKPGEVVELSVPPAEEAAPRAQPIDLTVVYEDGDLIVVDKPAGLVVHPAPGNPDRTLVNALLAHCGGSLSGIGGVRRPGIVHRLDKDTSGLLVAAKHDDAHAGLSEQFASHDIQRRYRALVWGVPAEGQGRIEGAIGRNPHNRKKMAVVARGGKPAVTHYRLLRAFGRQAGLLDCRLETGRTHQIRVHLTSIGHPVMGDRLYARARRQRREALPADIAAAVADFGRQALHAAELGFRHPISGEALHFHSDLPDDMGTLLHLLARMRKG
ncbi:MAG: RluA family pseudouridine synthase [Alphaproteobacteria bacterium]|jgi:23S rRNA pseudouridine1911/1915/1917 synthase|nr:RluA family pseudouridine synthase [Alphaproteobacteria bacterium]MDP6815049.1 RluA family pseudouridine synthase [Alphaproteobacteria bacterium]